MFYLTDEAVGWSRAVAKKPDKGHSLYRCAQSFSVLGVVYFTKIPSKTPRAYSKQYVYHGSRGFQGC